MFPQEPPRPEEILGLTQGASFEAVEAQWKALSKVWHPDRWNEEKLYPLTEEEVQQKDLLLWKAKDRLLDRGKYLKPKPTNLTEAQAYEILGLSPDASDEEVQKRYDVLDVWDTHQFFEQPEADNGIKNIYKKMGSVRLYHLSKKDVEAKFKIYSDAYEQFQQKNGARFKYKEELALWFAEEAKKEGKRKGIFTAMLESPHQEKIITNIFKLFGAKQLSYKNFISETFSVVEQTRLLNVVLMDDSVTDFICAHDNGDVIFDVKNLPVSESEFYKLLSHRQQDLIRKQGGASSSLTLFLLELLTNVTEKFRKTIEHRYECVQLGIAQLAARWMFDLVLAYQEVQSLPEEKTFDNKNPLSFDWMCYHLQKTPKEERIDYLFKHLDFLTDESLRSSSLLKATYDNLVKPFEEKIASKGKKKDEKSQEKVEQLQWCVDGIKDVVANNVAARLESSMDTEKQNQQDPLTDEKFSDVYSSAYNVTLAFARNPKIRDKTNKIQSFIKRLLCIAIAPAALISQRVRDGITGTVDSERLIKNSAETFLQSKQDYLDSLALRKGESEQRTQKAKVWKEGQTSRSTVSSVRAIGKPAPVIEADKENCEAVSVESLTGINALD